MPDSRVAPIHHPSEERLLDYASGAASEPMDLSRGGLESSLAYNSVNDEYFLAVTLANSTHRHRPVTLGTGLAPELSGTVACPGLPDRCAGQVGHGNRGDGCDI